MPDAHTPAASALRRALARLAVVLVALVVSTAVLAPASAAMTRHTRHHLMHIAASKKGTPYRYGATGPPGVRLLGLHPMGLHQGRPAPAPDLAPAGPGDAPDPPVPPPSG